MMGLRLIVLEEALNVCVEHRYISGAEKWYFFGAWGMLESVSYSRFSLPYL